MYSPCFEPTYDEDLGLAADGPQRASSRLQSGQPSKMTLIKEKIMKIASQKNERPVESNEKVEGMRI